MCSLNVKKMFNNIIGLFSCLFVLKCIWAYKNIVKLCRSRLDSVISQTVVVKIEGFFVVTIF